MSVLSDVFGAGGLVKGISEIIGKFKLSPEKKVEMQLAVEQNAHEIAKIQLELEAKILETQTREIEAAGANIRAEAASGDKFTSRARPLFLYVCNVILVCNYIIFPLINRPPLEFPEPLFWLFGSVMLGYVGARSWEKISQTKNGKK